MAQHFKSPGCIHPYVRSILACTLLMLAFALPAAHGLQEAPGEAIRPLPLSIEVDAGKVALGEKLFHDPRLAKNNAMACANCHQLSQGGDDGLPQSITNTGKPDAFNAPTVFNVAFNYRQTWRGAFRTLEEHAAGVISDPLHMDMSLEEVARKFARIPKYAAAFAQQYPDGVTPANILDSIATYERSLITPNARFDRYLRGDTGAISKEERRGYTLFKSHGCAACHQGVNIGGNLMQKMGIFKSYYVGGRTMTRADLGYINVTGDEDDRNVFRVPSLRNVAVTAPYFHDGNVTTLVEAVRIMADIQLGHEMPEEETWLIVKFLYTLTGEYRGRPLSNGGEQP